MEIPEIAEAAQKITDRSLEVHKNKTEGVTLRAGSGH
jgi:hypothetical protein